MISMNYIKDFRINRYYFMPHSNTYFNTKLVFRTDCMMLSRYKPKESYNCLCSSKLLAYYKLYNKYFDEYPNRSWHNKYCFCYHTEEYR